MVISGAPDGTQMHRSEHGIRYSRQSSQPLGPREAMPAVQTTVRGDTISKSFAPLAPHTSSHCTNAPSSNSIIFHFVT